MAEERHYSPASIQELVMERREFSTLDCLTRPNNADHLLLFGSDHNFKDNIIFNVSPNPGLYNQFGLPLNLSYVPQILAPTVIFHQTIKKNLIKQGIEIDEKKFPYNIYIPNFNAKVLLNVKIRLFQPNILSLTVAVSNLPSTLDALKLIKYQKINQFNPIQDIIQWTIRMATTLNHRDFDSLKPLGYKHVPVMQLDGICLPEEFQNHIKNNISKYAGILIRNSNYKSMGNKIQDVILEKNSEHNLKNNFELYLIDKQGILYLTPIETQIDDKIKSKLFYKSNDLYEIALVFGEYLSNYLSFRVHNEDLADFFLYKIRSWIEEPELIFRHSVDQKNIWNLLTIELGLKATIQAISKPSILNVLENKSRYFDQYSIDWWNENNFAYLLTKHIREAKGFQLDFLENKELKHLIIEDYSEAIRSLQSGNYKATILICGSIAEAILTAVIEKENILGISKNRLYKLVLNDLINTAREFDLIEDKNIFSLIEPLRNYRNMIHPGVQLRKSVSADLPKAKIALESINLLINDLNKTHKK